MGQFNLFGMEIPAWSMALGAFVLWLLIGFTLKKILFVWLEALSKRTSSLVDDIVVSASSFPIAILIVVSGVLYVPHLFFSDQLPFAANRIFTGGLKALVIFSIVLFINKLLAGLLRVFAPRIEVLRISGGFTQVLVRIIVFTIGGLVLLDSFGISITPILASLGVGSLAVALALQPTLENLISGFQIILDRPILPGQFVKLESGEEGYVEKIGWRSTWVRELANNMIIVPNKQIVNSRIRNYYYPSQDLAVLVQTSVHYASDLKKVERVTCEVGKEVMQKVKGGVPEFEPFIRYHTFADSSINFTVILRGKEFVDNYLVKHEFIKALADRYAKEGIVIPFPIRAINTDQENAIFKVNEAKATEANGTPKRDA